MLAKRNIVQHVHDTTMHILYNSSLQESPLWPKNGFKAGTGIGCKIIDRIYIVINAYGYEMVPPIGIVQLNIFNTIWKRECEQVFAIKAILDYAYYNNTFLEDEFRNSKIDTYRFKFTYTPPTQ
jgi:hypothetical protein